MDEPGTSESDANENNWTNDGGGEKRNLQENVERLKDSIRQLRGENEGLKKIESENRKLLKDREQLTWYKAVNEANTKQIQILEQDKQHIQSENKKMQGKLQAAICDKKSLQENIHVLKKDNELLLEEKESLLQRLSRFAAAQLTVDNPNIADLSDGKRPTKLAEDFTQLYDNEWTDAFEDMNIEQDQEKAAFMLKILQRTSQICKDVSRQHMKDIRTSLCTLNVSATTSPGSLPSADLDDKSSQEDSFDTGDFEIIEHTEAEADIQATADVQATKEVQANVGVQETANVKATADVLATADVQATQKIIPAITCDFSTLTPDQIKPVYEFKKFMANHLSERLKTVVTDIVVSEIESEIKKAEDTIIKYITKCADICWSMCQHEPPVYFDFPKTTIDTSLDVNVYKPYTKSGKYLDFIVWPALYLYEGGPLLSKGVAQGRS